MSKTAQIVKVKFPQRPSSKYPYRAPPNNQEYTYLIPEGVEVSVGDVLIVPVGPVGYGVNGFTRRATVVDVSTLEYKYAIGRVELF
jgi:hypothetical protein